MTDILGKKISTLSTGEKEKQMTDILGKKISTLSTGEKVEDWFLYCSRNCAKVDGCVDFKPLSKDADPDESAEDYGQLCPICECEYEFVDRL